jgi:predicted phosphodiesterase
MTLTRLIGDIHGLVYEYKSYAIGDFDGPTIQLGDFGVGFGQSNLWYEGLSSFMTKNNARMIRGNHDNPSVCKEMPGWINDGTVEDDIMYIGGAWSIDNPVAPPGWYRRTAGVDWWFDEECSDEQFEQMFEKYKQVKPRVMITHDCPATVSREMFWGSGFLKGPIYPNRTSAWFDRFYEAHQPEFQFFGHWHKSMTYKRGNTTFVCLGELDTIDVDLADSEQMHQAVFDKFNTN